ncbi:MAG: hypothetical protein JJ900_10350 [Rhodospirillales bacterium]|nr:hypothetical protein [Rhodospirillales bacterium]MBO6787240.1 hypothetical protein [Rhodospirillales bacterium]
MDFLRILGTAILIAAASASGEAWAQSPFNGEVLVAPAPPNWTGGTPEKTDTGIRREWRRGFATENGVVERVVITRSENAKDRVAQLAARDLAKAMTAGCAKPTVSEIKRDKAQIGTTASFTAQCRSVKDTPADTALFAMGKVYIGDFYTFSVRRIWLGRKDDPGSPSNSPRTGEQWAVYFSRISVCNTLTSPCDPAQAEIVHADPRFKTMRALPVSAKPVVSAADALKVGRKLGDLTGRAEACGEDVEPLTSKIERMFAHVTSNDQDSSKAVRAFATARDKGMKAQDAKSKESCGEVLRTFRQHPSRVGAFYRYIEQFL